MISKTIVENIIQMNDKIHEGESTETVVKSHAGEGIKEVLKGYSKEKKDLIAYIANLSFNDIIDLGGLADYGRELYQKGEKYNNESFHPIRANFFDAHEKENNAEGKRHLAIYFVKMGSLLSDYLRQVLFML